jgi:DNA-binding transcriptional ArsR family regulator
MANETVFKALADPTRRKILHLLGSGEMTAGQLAGHFDISAPSMSHHFNILKNADLVFVRRDGQQLYYSLNTTVFQDVLTLLFDIFPHMNDSETKTP